jgi:hypothetical protein
MAGAPMTQMQWLADRLLPAAEGHVVLTGGATAHPYDSELGRQSADRCGVARVSSGAVGRAVSIVMDANRVHH